MPYTQDKNDYCATYAVASALKHEGHTAAASTIAALAQESRNLDAGANVLKWLAARVRAAVQPAYRVRRIREPLSYDPLAPTEHGRIVLMQLVDSSGSSRHAVATAAGWIFDPNRACALPLTAANLDACCIGTTRYRAVAAGFYLFAASKAGSPPPPPSPPPSQSPPSPPSQPSPQSQQSSVSSFSFNSQCPFLEGSEGVGPRLGHRRRGLLIHAAHPTRAPHARTPSLAPHTHAPSLLHRRSHLRVAPRCRLLSHRAHPGGAHGV